MCVLNNDNYTIIIFRCIEWEEKGVEQVSHLERLKKILRSISRRLSTCDLDDFELVSDFCSVCVFMVCFN